MGQVLLFLPTRVSLGLIQRTSSGGKVPQSRKCPSALGFGGKLHGVPHLHAGWVEAWIKGFIQMLVSIHTASAIGTL